MPFEEKEKPALPLRRGLGRISIPRSIPNMWWP